MNEALNLMRILELPDWLMLTGGILVVVGGIGLAVRLKRADSVEDNPIDESSHPSRHQMPPLPNLLDSRRKSERNPMD